MNHAEIPSKMQPQINKQLLNKHDCNLRNKMINDKMNVCGKISEW